MEKEGWTAFKWNGGAIQNKDMDIMHNAKRIIDMLRHNGPKTKSDLARDLAPSGTHEMFSEFIDKVKYAELIEPVNSNDKNDLLHTKFTKEDDFAGDVSVNTLRLLYQSLSLERNIINLSGFTDLHPFKINVRLKWLNVGSDMINKIKSLNINFD